MAAFLGNWVRQYCRHLGWRQSNIASSLVGKGKIDLKHIRNFLAQDLKRWCAEEKQETLSTSPSPRVLQRWARLNIHLLLIFLIFQMVTFFWGLHLRLWRLHSVGQQVQLEDRVLRRVWWDQLPISGGLKDCFQKIFHFVATSSISKSKRPCHLSLGASIVRRPTEPSKRHSRTNPNLLQRLNPCFSRVRISTLHWDNDLLFSPSELTQLGCSSQQTTTSILDG